MPSAYSFIDIAVLDAVRERFAAGDAVVILSSDLAEVLWANGPGAALLGHAGIEAAVGADSGLSFAARRQIMSTRGFPEIGRDRAIAVRLTQGMASRAVMFSASAISLPDDEPAIMLVVPSADGAGAAALGGFTQPGHHVAFIDRDGLVEAASAGFEALDIPQALLAELVAEVGGEHDRLVKKIIRPDDRRLPAGIARLRDYPARHLLVIVDEAEFAEPDAVPDEGAETPTAVPAVPAGAAPDETAAAEPSDARPGEQPAAGEVTSPEHSAAAGIASLDGLSPEADHDVTPSEADFAPASPPDDADLPDAVPPEAGATGELAAETAPSPETEDERADAGEQPLEAEDRQAETVGEIVGTAATGAAEAGTAPSAEPPAPAFEVATTPAADVATAEEPTDVATADEEPPPAPPAIDRNAAPVRFVWRTDADGRFSAVSPEFLAAVGAASDAIVGQPFAHVSAALGLDPDGDIAGLLARRDTWSGRSVFWPVAGTNRQVPVDLAALPVYSRDRRFEGFRGFGVARLADMAEMPDAPGPAQALPAETDDADGLPAAGTPESLSETVQDAAAGTDATDPFQGEVPALTIAPKPDRRSSDKIIRLAEHRPPQPERVLSSSERSTFREIGERLRKEGGIDDDAATATAPDTGRTDTAADTLTPVAADAPLSLHQATDSVEESTPLATVSDDAAPAAISTDMQAGPGITAGEAAADTLEPLPARPTAGAEAMPPPALVTDHADAGYVEAPPSPADTVVVESAAGAEQPHLPATTPAEPSTSTAEPDSAADHGGHVGTLSFADSDAPDSTPDETGDAVHPAAPEKAVAAVTHEPHTHSPPTPSRAAGDAPLSRSTGERNTASAIGASSPPSNGGEVDRAKPETEWGSTATTDAPAAEREAITAAEAAGGDALPESASTASTWQDPTGRQAGDDTVSPTADDIAAPAFLTNAPRDASEPPLTAATAAPDAEATAAEAVPARDDTGSDLNAPGEPETQPATAEQPLPPAKETAAREPQGEPPFESADIAATVVPLSPVAAARAAIAELRTNGFVPSAFSAPAEPVKSGQDTPILARLPVPILIHSGDVLHYANDAFLTLTGYSSLVDLADAGGLDALFPESYDDEGSEDVGRALRLRTVDGQEFPVEALLRSVPWSGGRALMLVVRRAGDDVDVDLGDTEAGDGPDPGALKARVAEMRAIIDTATDGVILITRDGAIRSISRPAEALFGYESDEIAGRPFVALFAIESQRAARDYLNGLSDHGVASVLNDGREVIGRESQGRFIPLFMTIGKLPNDTGYCAVVRDITSWKRAEEELTQARTLAERASSQKSDFLARISHEIRTPLNAIIGFSELMVDERFGPIGNDRYRDYLQDINRSGNHVLELVNDLLDISKIEAGEQEMAHEAVSLNETLAQTVAMMQPQANRERVIIRSSFASRLPDVVADSRSVRQIALNLLSNAVRYTQAGGQVIVSTAYELSGDVVMRVRDTGIGMSPAEIEQALKPFKQINALKRPRGEGTGLGLPLTKAMVEANRARFTINSTPGEGTLVEVTFPSTRVLAN